MANNVQKKCMCKVVKNEITSKRVVNQSLTLSATQSAHTNFNTLGFRDGRSKVKSPRMKLVTRKNMSYRLNFELSQLNSSAKKSYERAKNCCNVIIQNGNDFRTNCCRSRTCYVCNGKRTRNLIEGYSTALQNFNDLHFVTLTIANVPFEILRTSAKKMNSDFAKIIRRSRDRGNVISALKTTEVTVRKTKKNHDSHPHFHIIVEGKKNAEYIRNEWIRIHPTYMVNSGAQKVESFANNGKTIQENLKEIFKYVTKLDPKEISIEDIDKIIVAMKGIQLIQTYGNIKKVDEDNFKETVKEMDIPYYENARWQYSPDYSDYIDYFTGMSMIHLIPIGDVLTQPPNPN